MTKVKSLIPNLLTAGNLVGGILAIIFSLTGHLEWAPYCIFISAFLDFFDGFAARLLNVQSEMGKQLDSLADMVTFGVAPGVMLFVLIKIVILLPVIQSTEYIMFLDYNGPLSIDPAMMDRLIGHADGIDHSQINRKFLENYEWAPLTALVIPVFAMFRLAKFNLDTRQSDSFIGVPTPAMTLFFASFPLILFSDHWSISYTGDLLINPWFLIISAIIFSFLMVAELPLFALKFKTFGWKGNEIRYIFLTLAVALLATLHWLAIPILIILYILLSIIQNLFKK